MSNLGKSILRISENKLGKKLHNKIHRTFTDDDSTMGKIAGLNITPVKKVNVIKRDTMATVRDIRKTARQTSSILDTSTNGLGG